jgi:enoyl-CoA hydratase/carnithine racemase
LVTSRTSGGVAIVTLNSPHNRNALSTALVDQLLAAVRAASRDLAVRVVVLSHPSGLQRRRRPDRDGRGHRRG